jgi:integrase
VEPTGRRTKGKPTLNIDESRKFLKTALDDGSPGAIASAMALMMGLRVTEITTRVVRDLDDDGRVLQIYKSKTRAGTRNVVIPPSLRPRLAALVVGKTPTDLIFTFGRHFLTVYTKRICAAAGVPIVPAHGLRGSAASTALQLSSGMGNGTDLGMLGEMTLGRTVEEIARNVGHADQGATLRKHYLSPGTEESSRGARLENMLRPDSGNESSVSVTNGDDKNLN